MLSLEIRNYSNVVSDVLSVPKITSTTPSTTNSDSETTTRLRKPRTRWEGTQHENLRLWMAAKCRLFSDAQCIPWFKDPPFVPFPAFYIHIFLLLFHLLYISNFS
jgi:hypothetical protein